MGTQNIIMQKTSLRRFSWPAMAAGVVSVISVFNVEAQDVYYAKVVSVEPIVESVRVSEPVEQCWVESQPAYNSYNSHRSNVYDNGYRSSSTPNILGVIIGGVIGNQFGSGRGTGLATVAGAVLGGSVANDIKQDNRYNRPTTSYRNVERCEITQQQHREERIVAYDVRYRYNGEVYHTQMDHRPGDEIKVAVNVVPVR